MKKIIGFMFISALLVGCGASGYSLKIADGSDTLISGSGVTVTKQGYFEYLLDKYGSGQLVADVLDSIADLEVEDQSGLEALIQKRVDLYTEYADGDLDNYATYLGFKDADEYIEKALKPDAKQELLRYKYIEENFDDLMDEYKVNRLKMIIVDKESTALNLIKELTTLDLFDAKMKEYDEDAEDLDIVTKDSYIDSNLVSILSDLRKVGKDGIYSSAVKLSDDTYAVLYIYDTAMEDLEEYYSTLS